MSDIFIKDPFLCDECQQLGYCKKGKIKYEFDNTTQISVAIIEELFNTLPLKTTLKYSQSYLARSMQSSHDALRETDYETAFLYYKTITSDGYYHWEAFLGLALCSFYRGEYLEAIRYAERIEIEPYSGWEDALASFTELCLYKSEQRIVANSLSTVNKHPPIKLFDSIE